MYLADIQLVPSTRDRALAGQLMASWRHVEDILRAFLPRRWSVGGVGKLNVILPIDAPADEYWHISSTIGEWRQPQFDLREFLSLPEPAQDLKAVSILEAGLRAACAQVAVPDEPVAAAIEQTRATGFRYQWVWAKLGRWNQSRSLRADILVTYRRGGTDVLLRVLRRGNVMLFDELVASGQLWESVWFDYFRSRWENSAFIVNDRVGKETLRRDAAA